MNSNKEYIEDCFKILNNNYQDISSQCIGYCVVCDSPIHQEGSLICAGCQRQTPPDETDHMLVIRRKKQLERSKGVSRI